MKFILFTLASFITLNLSGQIPTEEIRNCANEHDFTKFEKKFKKLRSKYKFYAAFNYSREIIDGYIEVTWNIQNDYNAFPDAIDSVYYINVLVKNKTIFCFEFKAWKLKRVQQRAVYYFEDVSIFKNELLFDKFKLAFKNKYYWDLKEEDIFNRKPYGRYCGLGVSASQEYLRMYEYIKEKNIDSLVVWLKSANTEKQVYALDGLHKLKTKGENISSEVLQLVNYVKSKKVLVQVCGGCEFGNSEMERVSKQFDF